jgi:hypothetical protein
MERKLRCPQNLQQMADGNLLFYKMFMSLNDLNGDLVVGYADCYSKGPGFESRRVVVLFLEG